MFSKLVFHPTLTTAAATADFSRNAPSRLVRYYRIAGFRTERDVGEDLGSLRDRLTWGAEGTLMSASADDFMRRWTPLMLNTNTSKGTNAVEKQEA